MKRAVTAISDLYERARDQLRAQVTQNGKLDRQKLEERQVAAHALAYLSTELTASQQMLAWAERVGGDHERAIAHAYIGEVARTLGSSVDLGSCESFDVREFGITDEDLKKSVRADDVLALAAEASNTQRYLEIAARAHTAGYGRSAWTTARSRTCATSSRSSPTTA